ncbi:hypothetical protein ACF1BS_04220 [Streptomyces sp. NPDC014748]|uniref:hypothetical protein n=1 Tax=Streptomyces sp. NPDC014748 TaxID=3364905 RepID=UPI0036F9AA58
MTEETPSDPSDEQPDPTVDDGAAAHPARPTPAVRVDFSQLAPFAEVARQLGEQATRMIAGIREQLDHAAATAAEGAAATAAAAAAAAASDPSWLAELQRTVRTQVTCDFGPVLGHVLAQNQLQFAKVQQLLAGLRQVIPENLRDLQAGDHEKVFQLTAEDGTSLAWAPRVAIVRELLAADGLEARSTVLVDHAVEIAEDVEASLATVALPQHQALRTLLLEAAAAVRRGLFGPAQAAASNAFDTTVNVHILEFLALDGPNTKDATRKHFRPTDDWGDITFAELELVLVGGGIATAYKRWSRGEGQPSFNRNGTAHQVDDGAYSPAHAIRALLLAQATLRWLDAAVSAAATEDAA